MQVPGFLSVFDVFNPEPVPCSRNTLQNRKFSSITHSNAMRRQVSDVEGKGRNLRQFHIGFLGFSRTSARIQWLRFPGECLEKCDWIVCKECWTPQAQTK